MRSPQNSRSRRILPSFMALLLVLAAGIAHAQEDVFVEAESFAEKGGWVVDQQFMDQMGSPFLLAHGLGVPVGDAQATVSFPSAATYHVYVRTRDWVPGYGPGQFSLTVAGTVLDTIFGASGDGSWAWKYGGTVTVGAGDAALTIQDLTGFDGRVDAIAFTRTQQAPPDNGPDLLAYRRQMLGLPTTPADAGTFDLVVVGGGMSGIGAAISAARQGLQVALVQNRPVLGGNNSSEVRVHLGGGINLEPLPDVGNIVAEVSPSNGGNAGPAARYEDDKKLSVVSAESNIHLYLNNHVYAAEVDQSRIVAVRARNIETGVETRFPGALFADCTGDGNLGFMAGADYRMGREGQSETGESLAPPTADDMHMGFSNMWYSVNDGMPSTFPECPWALQFSSPYEETNGGWDWESGFYRNVFDEGEHIRDHNLRAVFGAWASYKNDPSTASTVANRSLGWVAYISGKRESRRLMGDYILTEQDIRGGVLHSDGCVFTTWGLDLHYPLAVNECEPECESFRSRFETRRIEPYPIPYRCLYSRNIPNLFMAGRCISVTHVALGTVRVMRTCGMMGEVVGKAAALCREHGIAPRQVYEERLDELFDALGGTPLTMDLVVDDTAAVKTGAWTASSSNQGFYGEGYHHDGNNGKGTKSVQYSLAAPEDGAYKLFMRWSAASNRSSNTPIIVSTANGLDTLFVNMRERGERWVELGEYTFSAMEPGTVTVATFGTDGYVIADAVALRRAEQSVAARVAPALRHSGTVRVHTMGVVFDLAIPSTHNTARARLLVLDLHGRVLGSFEVNLSAAQQDVYCDVSSGAARGALVLSLVDQAGASMAARTVVVSR